MESAGGHGHRLPAAVWIIALVNTLTALGFGVMSPVLPVYARTFGVSGFLIGLVVSSLAIVRLVTMPVCGRLMRLVGPRELAIAGSALVTITTFLVGVAQSYWGVLIWRGLTGLGSGLVTVTTLSILFTVTPAHMRGRANAVSGGGWVLGGMVGPALGGLVATISIHAPFFFYSAMLLISIAVIWVGLPRTPREHQPTRHQPSTGLRQLLRDRRFTTALLVNFANGWQSNGVRNLLVPLFVVESLHRSTSFTGIAFAVAAVVQAGCLPLTGWSVDRFPRRTMVLIGALLAGVTSIGLALAGSYAWLLVLLALYAIGASTMGSASQAMLADTVPITASPGLAAYQMSADLGTIGGPLVAGAVVDGLGLPVAWLFGAVALLAGAGLAWRLPTGRQPRVGDGLANPTPRRRPLLGWASIPRGRADGRTTD